MKPEVRLHGASFDFAVPLGSEPPSLTGGSPNWEEVARPGRVAMTDYRGQGLIRVDLPIFFDGWPDSSVESKVERVLRLCRGRDGERPPDFTATGPMPYSGSRFVMELPDWGDGLRAGRGTGIRGELVRQALTLKLLQFVDPATVRFQPRGIGIGKARPVETIVQHDGETLLEVAARVYGSVTKAGEIAKLNGIRDTRRGLKAGKHLALPG